MKTQPATGLLGSGDDRTYSNAISARLGAAAGLLAFLGYLPGVDRPFFYDEAQTVGFFIVDGSPLDALRRQRLFNNHPLLSFIDNVLVQATGRSDEWILRLPPLVFAALAIGLVVGAVHAAWGAAPAIAAGAIVATNPMFVEYGRAVRGYSLLVLAATASTILLLRALRTSRERALLGYVVVAALGMLTHLFMAPVLLVHAVEVIRRRAVDRRWMWSWAGIVCLSGLFYASMIGKLWTAGGKLVEVDGGATAAEEAAFFPTLAFELLGGSTLSAWILGALSSVGIVHLRRSTLSITIASVAALIAAVAWAAAPENTGPRFFLWLVPAVAVASAATVRRWPLVAVPAVVVSAIASMSAFAPDYVDTHSTYPDIAGIVEHAAVSGARTCVSDLSVPPLLAYTRSFDPIVDPDDIAGCDLLAVAAPDLDEEYLEPARTHFSEHERVGHGFVFRSAR